MFVLVALAAVPQLRRGGACLPGTKWRRSIATGRPSSRSSPATGWPSGATATRIARGSVIRSAWQWRPTAPFTWRTASAAIGFEPFPPDGRVSTLAGGTRGFRGRHRRRRPIRHAVRARNRGRRYALRRRHGQQRDSPDYARRHRDDPGGRWNGRVAGRPGTRGALQRAARDRRRCERPSCSSPTRTTIGSASSSSTASSERSPPTSGSTRQAVWRSTRPATCTSPTHATGQFSKSTPRGRRRCPSDFAGLARPIGVATAPGGDVYVSDERGTIWSIHAGRLVANRGRVGPRVSRWSGARSALQEAERGCGGRRGTFDRRRRGKRVGAAGRRAVAPRVPGASCAAHPSAVRPRDVSGAAVGMADRADRGPARDCRHGWRSARRRRRAHAPRHRRACRTGHARARSSRRRCGQPDVARGVRHAQRDDHAWSRHLHSRARRPRAEQCGLRSIAVRRDLRQRES